MKVYACGIGYQHDPDFTVFRSVEELREKLECCPEECGIVELELLEVQWVEPQKIFSKEEEEG